MDDTTILGSTLGQLGQTIKKAGQQFSKLPGEIAADLGEQIGGEKTEELKQGQKQEWQSDEERVKFLKDLYGSTKQASSEEKPREQQASANPSVKSAETPKTSEFQEQIKDKSPEEQKQLIELRNQLHKENYYDPTFNPVKKQEERPAEKVENEKKQEMMELQEKEDKKPQPIAVVREQNKAEMFRGAAG